MDDHFRSTSSEPPHIGVLELNGIVILQHTTHFLPKDTFTNAVDDDEFTFSITDGSLKCTFEIPELELELLAIAQVPLVVNQFMQVQIDLGHTIVLGLFRGLTRSCTLLFLALFLQRIVGSDEFGLMIAHLGQLGT